MGFAINQLVLCVKHGSWKPCAYGEQGPVGGRVYTVRHVTTCPIRGLEMIRVHEIVNPIHAYRFGPDEACFDARQFRPLDESRLTVFRQMLVTPPSPELVDEDLDARIADCERAVREALGF